MGLWPNKTIPQMTDAELATAIEQNQGDTSTVTQQITEGCVREWERRNGLTEENGY